MTEPTPTGIPDSYSGLATDLDVVNCYRLLLNRLPDPGGYSAFSSMISRQQPTIPELVTMFLESAEFRHGRPDLVRAAPRFEDLKLVDLGSARLYVSSKDWAIGENLVNTGLYEPHLTPLVVNALRPGMTFVDVGANIGYFTVLAAAAIGPGGRVWAFEPDSWNCTQLNASLTANGFTNVNVLPAAVADASRTYMYESQGSNGMICDFDGNFATVGTRTLVRSLTLDLVLNGQPCDVLKMDVEGAEALVWRGALELIRRTRPLVFTEFSPPMLERASHVSGKEYLQSVVDERYRFSVVDFLGNLQPCGTDLDAVIEAYQRAGTTHIDLMAEPA